MDLEVQLLNEILNFKVEMVPDETRFWMVRTKKGYFYDEFLGKKFIALAWNNITRETNLSDEENLSNLIQKEYPEIRRPRTVINKCKSFIYDMKKGDIVVIPNKGTAKVAFVRVGDYFEDDSKTIEIEKEVIKSIENNDVRIKDVSCPYKKRREIEILKVMDSENINYNLYRAITSYHGISNLDDCSRFILSAIYNVYTFNNDLNIVFNVRKKTPISPLELSGMLYGTTKYLCEIGIPEENISTQININSPGPIDFAIVDVFNYLKDNWMIFAGILVAFSGGSIASVKINGIPDIMKNILSIKTLHEKDKLENERLKLENKEKELELIDKKIELINKIRASGIDPEALTGSLETVIQSANNLEICSSNSSNGETNIDNAFPVDDEESELE